MPNRKQIVAELKRANDAVWGVLTSIAARLTLENMVESQRLLDVAIWDILDTYPQEEREKYYKHLSRTWHADKLNSQIPEWFKRLPAPNKDELLARVQITLNSYKDNNFCRPNTDSSSPPADDAQYSSDHEDQLMHWILKKLHPLYSGYARYPEPWKSRIESILICESILTPTLFAYVIIALLTLFVLPEIVIFAWVSLMLLSIIGIIALAIILNTKINNAPIFQYYQNLNIAGFFKLFGQEMSSKLFSQWPDSFLNQAGAALFRSVVLLTVPFVILGYLSSLILSSIMTTMMMALTISVNLIVNLPLYCLDLYQLVASSIMGFVPQQFPSNSLPTDKSLKTPDSGSCAYINTALMDTPSDSILKTHQPQQPIVVENSSQIITNNCEDRQHLMTPSARMFTRTQLISNTDRRLLMDESSSIKMVTS